MTAVTHAQEPSTESSPELGPDEREEVLRRAETLLREANASYAAQDYTDAREAYQAAYDLTDAAGFLYNIAQSYRLAGQCRLAIASYERYLAAEPDTQLREKIEGFVAQMWICVEDETSAQKAEEKAAPRLVAQAEPQGSAAMSTQARPEEGPRSQLPTIGLVLAGSGIAFLGTSAYFGLTARSISADVEGFREQWNSSQEAKERDGQSAERLAVITGLVGGAALLGGIATYFYGTAQNSQVLALEPSSDGVVLSFSDSF